jgi:hypothetical protein
MRTKDDNSVLRQGFADYLAGVEHRMALYLGRVVELAQRRIKKGEGTRPGRFEYLAQKRRHIRPPLVFGEPFRTRLIAVQRMALDNLRRR